MNITAVLTPEDDFAGRNRSRFGIGEIIQFSFSSSPDITAASVGGLKWFIEAGDGTITGGNDGLATFTAPGEPGEVRLELKVMSGLNLNMSLCAAILDIVAPSKANIILGSGLRHTQGSAGVGFKGNIFFSPNDVSFKWVEFQEGSVAAVASGYFSPYNGLAHRQTPTWLSIGGGNSSQGCQLLVQDLIDSGNYPTTGFSDRFGDGDFLWSIPWKYRIDGRAETVFQTTRHHQSIDGSGKVTIEKDGAGPFSKDRNDATSTF